MEDDSEAAKSGSSVDLAVAELLAGLPPVDRYGGREVVYRGVRLIIHSCGYGFTGFLSSSGMYMARFPARFAYYKSPFTELPLDVLLKLFVEYVDEKRRP